MARCSASAKTFYYFGFSNFGTSEWVLRKSVAGTDTQLVAPTTVTLAVGSYSIEIIVQGTTISGLVNGIQVLTVTDSSISAAGFAGVFSQSPTPGDTANIHIQNIVGSSISSLVIGTVAASATDAAITLTLSAGPSGGTGPYTTSVYRGTTPNFTPGTALGTFSGTTYVDSTAGSGTDYYYLVTAVDSASNAVTAVPAGWTGVTTASAVCGRLQLQRLGVVFIGDSVTYGAEANPGVGPTAGCQAALAQQWGNRTVTTVSAGTRPRSFSRGNRHTTRRPAPPLEIIRPRTSTRRRTRPEN
jgi:hypothetical protein